MKAKDRKAIKFNYEGSDYTLEYTVASIRKMERDGFDFSSIDKHIVNAGYELFSGALIAHHNYIPPAERDKMYEQLCAVNGDGENLLEALAGMLSDEVEFLVNKPQGKIPWAMV